MPDAEERPERRNRTWARTLFFHFRVLRRRVTVLRRPGWRSSHMNRRSRSCSGSTSTTLRTRQDSDGLHLGPFTAAATRFTTPPGCSKTSCSQMRQTRQPRRSSPRVCGNAPAGAGTRNCGHPCSGRKMPSSSPPSTFKDTPTRRRFGSWISRFLSGRRQSGGIAFSVKRGHGRRTPHCLWRLPEQARSAAWPHRQALQRRSILEN